MIAVLALLCAVTIEPADCGRDNAVDVIALPPAANELICMMEGQMTLAALAIKADDEYRWIVKCQSTSIGKDTIG